MKKLRTRKTRVFLTGSSGFIGRNLLERLETSHDMLAPTHQELDLLDDEAVRRYMRKRPVDVLIHAATVPGHRNAKDPERLSYRNLRMFFNLTRNRDCFGTLITLGSGAEYDMRHYRPRIHEDYFDQHVPLDEGGFSKYVCAQFAAHAEGIAHLRPFGVFGKYEDYEIRFISNAICKTLFDLPITLRQNRRFDYLYIDDLVSILERFILRPPSCAHLNVTPGSPIELKTAAETVLSVAGKRLPILIAKPGMGPEYSGDNSRLLRELPRFQFTPFRTAIERLYDWYASRIDVIRREALLADK